MIKLFPLRFACCLFFILAPLAPTRAQLVSPWFRGPAQSWKALKETSFSAARLAATPLSAPMSGLSTGQAVKTTVPNWLMHRLSHSNTFSAMEKEIFKTHPANTVAVTGKLSYFWDRDALLAANAAPGEINEKAFTRHQQLLQNTLAEVENFSLEDISTQFHSSVFSQEEMLRALKDPTQPQAFILTRREVEEFPQLSLQEQLEFARNAWRQSSVRLMELLNQEPQTITTHAFSDYYYIKLRQRYFTTLFQVMARAQAPRQTIIVRVRRKIPLDFLPEADKLLTDAQRLGKLHFHLGLMQSRGQQLSAEAVALKTEITRQTELYHPYALAEAFGLPYEQVLRSHVYNAKLYFSDEEAARLNMLTSEQAVSELPAKIAQVQAQMRELLGTKTASPDVYVHYLRLQAREEFLLTRLAQAKFFLQYRL